MSYGSEYKLTSLTKKIKNKWKEKEENNNKL